MAFLSETLGSSRAPSSRTSGYGSTSYRPPKMENPFGAVYGANRPNLAPGNQNLYASLLQSQQGQSFRPFPSTRFQAQYDYDPILARISALGEMSIANARTEAAELRKRALIEAGDPDVARELGADANTIQAAQGNTFSTKARLDRDYSQRGRELDESTNMQNLFYSGERVRQLQDLERGRAEANVDFGKVLRDLLATAQYELTRAEEAEQQRQLQASLEAAAKAQAAAAARPAAVTTSPVRPTTSPTPAPVAPTEVEVSPGVSVPTQVFPPEYHGTLQTPPGTDETALLSYLFPENNLVEDPYTYGLGGPQGGYEEPVYNSYVEPPPTYEASPIEAYLPPNIFAPPPPAPEDELLFWGLGGLRG